MGRDLLLWLLGVPISIVILLHLFGVSHWRGRVAQTARNRDVRWGPADVDFIAAVSMASNSRGSNGNFLRPAGTLLAPTALHLRTRASLPSPIPSSRYGSTHRMDTPLGNESGVLLFCAFPNAP